MIYNEIIDKFYLVNEEYTSNNLTEYELNYIILSLNFYKTIDGDVFSLRDELHSINRSILNKLNRENDLFILDKLSDIEFKVLKTALKTYSFIKEENKLNDSL